jgi:hypothetical protein
MLYLLENFLVSVSSSLLGNSFYRSEIATEGSNDYLDRDVTRYLKLEGNYYNFIRVYRGVNPALKSGVARVNYYYLGRLDLLDAKLGIYLFVY